MPYDSPGVSMFFTQFVFLCREILRLGRTGWAPYWLGDYMGSRLNRGTGDILFIIDGSCHCC